MTGVPTGQRGVGFVFQNYAIFTHMTVHENLAFGLARRCAARRRPSSTAGQRHRRDCRRSTRLLDRKARHACRSTTCSGRARSHDDRRAGDLPARRAVLQSRRRLPRVHARRAEAHPAQFGQTMVYVTHDQVEAMTMADRIAVMDLGVLQQYGTPLELYNKPANRFVARFIGSVLNNFLPATYETLNGRRRCASAWRGADRSTRPTRRPRSRAARARARPLSVRPERTRIVPADSEEATIPARVVLVEPLGAKDVVHLDSGGIDVRTLAQPSARPRIGENVGLAFDQTAVHVFDDETGLALGRHADGDDQAREHHETLRARDRARWRLVRGRRRRVLRDPRPSRRRQDDDAPHDHRPRAA